MKLKIEHLSEKALPTESAKSPTEQCLNVSLQQARKTSAQSGGRAQSNKPPVKPERKFRKQAFGNPPDKPNRKSPDPDIKGKLVTDWDIGDIPADRTSTSESDRISGVHSEWVSQVELDMASAHLSGSSDCDEDIYLSSSPIGSGM